MFSKTAPISVEAEPVEGKGRIGLLAHCYEGFLRMFIFMIAHLPQTIEADVSLYGTRTSESCGYEIASSTVPASGIASPPPRAFLVPDGR